MCSWFHWICYVCRVCRIQLRLPAGGTTVVEMNRTDTLSVLRETVAQVSCTKSYLCMLLLQWPVGDPPHTIHYWGECEWAPPSGVAGRNVHLYIHLYHTSCRKLLAALMNRLLNRLPPQWLAHVEVLKWKCSVCPCHLSISYIMSCTCPASLTSQSHSILQRRLPILKAIGAAEWNRAGSWDWCPAEHMMCYHVWHTCWSASLTCNSCVVHA